VRPDHRSHRRAHGLEARPVQEGRAAHSPNAIFASNTSGLSITKLSEGFDADLKARFCGVHFFNPPRYMHLVEIIPTESPSQKSATSWKAS
jgi:3-hydroxyacyl-CoA dehydrogenase